MFIRWHLVLTLNIVILQFWQLSELLYKLHPRKNKSEIANFNAISRSWQLSEGIHILASIIKLYFLRFDSCQNCDNCCTRHNKSEICAFIVALCSHFQKRILQSDSCQKYFRGYRNVKLGNDTAFSELNSSYHY